MCVCGYAFMMGLVCVCALINFYDGLGVCVCEYAFIMGLVCVCVCVCVDMLL